MTFEEWLTDFFTGIPIPPPHVTAAYKSAYIAGHVAGQDEGFIEGYSTRREEDAAAPSPGLPGNAAGALDPHRG